MKSDKSITVLVSSCAIALLLSLSSSIQAAPPQQIPDASTPPPIGGSGPPQAVQLPENSAPFFSPPAGARDAVQQQQQQSSPPASPNSVTQATTPATTLSPFKLPTVMPELDSNKELLDYDNELLASLKFYPTPAELAAMAATSLKQVNQSSSLDAAGLQDAGDQSSSFEKFLINRYHDHDQLYAYLLQLQQTYPKVTRLYDIGTSVEGRKLWVLEISEQPSSGHELLKPDFRYIANIHGNEAVGRELLLHLARLILDNYHHEESPGVDAAQKSTGVKFIKKLVKATRIHLMPSMNPDGFARSDVACMYETPSMKGRLNANNVNLNRNFPDGLLGTREDAGTQPEVRAVIDWSRREPFVLSANLHGGALVASIPYDGSGARGAPNNASIAALVDSASGSVGERRSPDHVTYMELARAYTRSHPTMWKGEMCYDKCTDYHPEVFPDDGITVGSAWYSLEGGMQDWMYENTNDFHVTLELGCNQYPPPEALHQYWQLNKVSLLNYMRQIHRGIKGVISDEVSGRPLANVRVHVRSIDHSVNSTQAGDYFRLLAPGNYQVAFEHADYHPVEIFVVIGKTMAQIHNIKMKPRVQATAGGGPAPVPSMPTTSDGQQQVITTTDLDGESAANHQQDSQHSIAVATLVMTVVTIVLLILLAGAYVVQKRRISRSQSVSVELQPSGRSAGHSSSGTGLSLPPLAQPASGKLSGSGRTSLSPRDVSA